MTITELKEFRRRWEAQLNPNNDERHYVYLYRYPAEKGVKGKVFYVGKGKGDRVFSHFDLVTDEDKAEIAKVKIITELGKQNIVPDIDILRDSMTEEMAFSVESAVIDAFGLENLTNIHRGKKSRIHPIQESPYILEDAVFKHNMLGVVLKQTFPQYFPELVYNSANDRDWQTLYELSSWCWNASPQKAEFRRVTHFFVTYNKMIREVYQLDSIISIAQAIKDRIIMITDDNRVISGFTYRKIVDDKIATANFRKNKRMLIGRRADEEIRSQYIGRRVIIDRPYYRYFPIA